ncbi:MAG TPA: hypothetical protein VEQ58_07410, partial [Polyangiaceae bacterium]|nr:hypothetical protein [Polyangiaceae bacterium]
MRAWFRSFVTACWLLRATAAHGALSDASTIASPAPERLLITVVTTEAALPTFEQRVSSWFSDGTQVTVVLAREVTPELILTTAPGELRVCVVPRDSTHALVTFATQQAEDSRHLLRDVRLRDGFDELGLERLASVIHSAAMALREGVEGAARADAERDLEELGLLPATDSAPPSPPPRSAEVTAPRRPARRKAQRMSWLLGAEYGARARGAEALGHGPGALLGLQLPSAHGSIDVVLRAQA